MKRGSKQLRSTAKLVFLLLLLAAFLSSGFLFMGYRICNNVMHKRNLSDIEVSLDPKQFPYEEITFKSTKDNINLKGVFFTSNSPSGRTVVLVHGLNENRMMGGRTEMLVGQLIPQGFNVLAFDLRGQGRSDGDLISFGCYEKYDVMGAIDYLKQRGGEGERIALLGFSMGAVTAIETAAMDSRVDAVIADSPFRDLKLFLENDLDTLPNNLSELSDNAGGLLYWSIVRHIPINDTMIRLASKIYNIKVDDISPVSALRNTPDMPIFLIHGKEDRIIPYVNSEEIYKALSTNSDAFLWLTDKAGHVGSLATYPDEYLKRITEFLNKYM